MICSNIIYGTFKKMLLFLFQAKKIFEFCVRDVNDLFIICFLLKVKIKMNLKINVI